MNGKVTNFAHPVQTVDDASPVSLTRLSPKNPSFLKPDGRRSLRRPRVDRSATDAQSTRPVCRPGTQTDGGLPPFPSLQAGPADPTAARAGASVPAAGLTLPGHRLRSRRSADAAGLPCGPPDTHRPPRPNRGPGPSCPGRSAQLAPLCLDDAPWPTQPSGLPPPPLSPSRAAAFSPLLPAYSRGSHPPRAPRPAAPRPPGPVSADSWAETRTQAWRGRARCPLTPQRRGGE
ncbi:uncharacterized protein LOC103792659 [Callithrix jacchus]